MHSGEPIRTCNRIGTPKLRRADEKLLRLNERSSKALLSFAGAWKVFCSWGPKVT